MIIIIARVLNYYVTKLSEEVTAEDVFEFIVEKRALQNNILHSKTN